MTARMLLIGVGAREGRKGSGRDKLNRAGLDGLERGNSPAEGPPPGGIKSDTKTLKRAAQALSEYFLWSIVGLIWIIGVLSPWWVRMDRAIRLILIIIIGPRPSHRLFSPARHLGVCSLRQQS